MAKKVYTPNRFFDIVLPPIFFGEVVYVGYELWKDGTAFYILAAATAIVALAVFVVEKLFNAYGKWVSHRYLNDSKHNDPLNKVYTLKKFCDQSWQLVYHIVFSIWEYILLRKYNWFAGERFYYSHHEVLRTPFDVQILFLFQIALWLYQGYRHLFINQRKKDYYELLIHHIATYMLCYYAYVHYYKHGLIILFIHDSSDILVDLLKLFNLCKLGGAEDFFALEIVYGVMLVYWSYQRLYLFPRFIINNVMREYLQVHQISSFFEKHDRNLVICVQTISLWVLEALHIYWTILLIRLGYRALVSDRENIDTIQKEGYEGASDDSDEEVASKED